MEYRRQFYITLFSNASQKVHSSNTLAEFTIQLAQRIDLGSTDNWEVGLCKFSSPPLKSGTLKPIDVIGETNAIIYCDLITPQFFSSDYDRCLPTFIHPSKYCDHAFQNVYYIPDEKRTFQDISILITDLNGKQSFEEWCGAYESGSTILTRINAVRQHLRPSLITMDPLVQYYRRQAGRGREDIRPMYSTPPFLQRRNTV